MASEKFRLQLGTGVGRVDDQKHIIYGVSAAQAVEALGHKMQLDQRTLEQIVEHGNRAKQGNGLKARYTHPGLSSDGMGKLLGRGRNWYVEGDKAKFDLHLVPSAFRSYAGGLKVSLGEYVEKLAQEDPDLFGMSIVFSGHRVWTLNDGREIEYEDYESPPEGALTTNPVVRIDSLAAVDAVDEPAANRDGMFSQFSEFFWATNRDAESAFADIDELLETYNVSPHKAEEFVSRYFAARSKDTEQAEVSMAEAVVVSSGSTIGSNTISFDNTGGLQFTPSAPAVADQSAAMAALQAEMEKVRFEAARARFEVRLAQSGLTAGGQRAVLAAVDAGVHPDKADALIENQRESEAKLRENTTISGITPIEGRVNGMLNDMDKLQAATDAMLEGRRPANGIKPLQGIKELYMLTSGDYEMTGRFHRENVSFAAVTTATMPGLVSNAMNKKVVRIFQNYDRWWEKLTGPGESATNLQDLRWHKLGGIGEMPSVSEGAAYTETEWVDDYETSGWTKKGHYLGLTLESIDKDDTRKLMLAPAALAQSAYLTLSKDVGRLFTVNSGTGPTMRDTYKWFDSSNHGNLGTSAFSAAAIKATILAMQKQTEQGSGERIGNLTYPKYFLIPLDLQFTAVDILASGFDPSEGSTTSFLKDNILANGETFAARRAAAESRLIVVPHWTDANDWAAIADPNLFQSIGLSFRFGSEPEIFSVSDPNSGLMFTNDTAPIKVRWFYNLGIVDHRGAYKHNVT